MKKEEIKNNYQKYEKNSSKYKLKRDSKALLDGKAEYIEWDPMHKEVEAYDRNGAHLGALETENFTQYRPADPSRNFFK